MKKFLMVLIATCLSISALNGCSNSTESASDNSNTTDTSEITSDSVVSEESIENTSESDSATKINFDFSSTDIDGKAVSFSDYSDNSIIMVNLWEPWCGPCVEEMPDLEALYQEYKDEGFIILGIFSTKGDDESVYQVLEDTGVTYPVIHSVDSLLKYQTGYVPTSFFVDKKGNLLSSEPIIGSNSYEDWKGFIEGYLH